MKKPSYNYSLESGEVNTNKINIDNGNKIFISTYNENISNLNNEEINFSPIDIQNSHNYNHIYKNHKNLVLNSNNINKRVKKIITDYENSKIEYEKLSEKEKNKKENRTWKELNNNKNIDIKDIKNIGEMEEKDEYKELYKSKLFYINYYLLYL